MNNRRLQQQNKQRRHKYDETMMGDWQQAQSLHNTIPTGAHIIINIVNMRMIIRSSSNPDAMLHTDETPVVGGGAHEQHQNAFADMSTSMSSLVTLKADHNNARTPAGTPSNMQRMLCASFIPKYKQMATRN